MTVVNSQDLARMRADQADSLHDTCVILTYSESQNGFGEMAGSWTAGAALACGFEPTGGREKPRAGGDTLIVEGRLRLPLTTTIGTRDRVRITHRHGTALSPALTFDVAGLPRRGPSGLVVDLREVS